MRRARHTALAWTVSLTLFGVGSNAFAQPACTAPKTTCAGSDGYYASTEDVNRVTAVVDPLLKDLRACLDAAGGKHVSPGVMIRWDSEGNAVGVKVDAPGYDSLPCVAKVSGKLSQLQNPHETAIRCDYGCAKPAAPPPAPVPAVVPPPATAPAPPAATPAPAVAKPEKPAPRMEKVWYGWQTLITDAASVTMLVIGDRAEVKGLTTAGIITFLLGTPIVHMAHGNIGPGFGSIGIRLLLPLIGAGIGALGGVFATTGENLKDTGSRVGDAAKVGVLVAVGGCVLIDAAALAYTKEKVEATALGRGTPETPRQIVWSTLTPSVALSKDGASLGVGGRF